MTVLALSMGDPAGIGLDIALCAWVDRNRTSVPAFFLIGDPAALTERAALLGLDVPLAETVPEAAASLFGRALPVMPTGCPVRPVAGKPDIANADAILESIRLGVDFASTGKARALVTNPIAKSVLYAAGFKHPGHTEYLAALASERTGTPVIPVMLLAGPELKVAPVTIHIPLADVPAALTTLSIVETGLIVAADLARRFALPAPRLAISGLNPHAGEGGALGDEDERIIAPAIEQLRASGVDARGPLPADTMFHPEARAGYDAAICMYHDQALIPAKTLAFHDGVNVTLGLPFIRTSPDHGTAFAIAGTGAARADSLAAALRMASTMADDEAIHGTIHEGPDLGLSEL